MLICNTFLIPVKFNNVNKLMNPHGVLYNHSFIKYQPFKQFKKIKGCLKLARLINIIKFKFIRYYKDKEVAEKQIE